MKTLALQNRTHKIGLAVLIIITVSILSLLAGCAKKEEVSSVPAVEGKSSVQTSEHPETEASEEQPEAEAEDTVPDRVADDERPMVYAHVNGSTPTIMPSENDSANAFIDLLREGDITVDMHDYGGFEKVGSLGTTLPRNDEQITTEPGDVILYQGDQITIYYDVNSWSFTRLGKVQGKTQDELKGILGTGDVKVVFSLDAETDETEENITVGTFDFETHTVMLNSGHKMPIIGLGTWTLSNDEAENSTYHALKNGMRLIDTARYYGNEVGVGRGLQRAIDEGIVKREDVFITSKIYGGDYERAGGIIDEVLADLNVEYIDLLLIHQPGADDAGVYKAMEEAVEDGRLRSIGMEKLFRVKSFLPSSCSRDFSALESVGCVTCSVSAACDIFSSLATARK